MAELIHRGQDEGVFRTDMSADWLVGVVHYILHGAAKQTRAGRLDQADVVGLVTSTVRSVLG
jgi:hypothetical protein